MHVALFYSVAVYSRRSSLLRRHRFEVFDDGQAVFAVKHAIAFIQSDWILGIIYLSVYNQISVIQFIHQFDSALIILHIISGSGGGIDTVTMRFSVGNQSHTHVEIDFGGKLCMVCIREDLPARLLFA